MTNEIVIRTTLVSSFFSAGYIAFGVLAAFAVEPEFLITSDRVISLRHPEVSLRPGTVFDKATLSQALPEYQFERGEEEDQSVWYVFARRNKDGQAEGGIAVYLDREGETKIDFISGGEGVFDSAGATKGTSLTEIFRKGTAKCWFGLDTSCTAEFSSKVFYSIGEDNCPDTVKLVDYDEHHKLSKLHSCLKVYSISLNRN